MSDWNCETSSNGVNKVAGMTGNIIGGIGKYREICKQAEYMALLEQVNNGNIDAQVELGKKLYEKERGEIAEFGKKLIDDAASQGHIEAKAYLQWLREEYEMRAGLRKNPDNNWRNALISLAVGGIIGVVVGLIFWNLAVGAVVGCVASLFWLVASGCVKI